MNEPKLTDELLTEILSKRMWYKPLGWNRNTASDFKNEFLSGYTTESRKMGVLKELGYSLSQPITWVKV